ncbi:MAG: carboxypeptidase M32, partial [Planctomycetota bacterium]
MTEKSPQDRLFALWGEIRDLENAEALLSWDQETGMPPRGQGARGRCLATLAGLKHARLTDPGLSEVLDACAGEAAPGSEPEAQVREARRHVDRAVRVPVELAKALAAATSSGLVAWQKARRKADFALFRDHLVTLVRLRREQAAAIDPARPPYDVLMDEFEPGATEEELTPLFAKLREALAPLVRGVAECGQGVDERPALGHYPPEKQLAFGRMAAARMGFDFEAGRIDRSTHPFCTGFGPGDVRITWRCQEDDFRPALFGIMHEAGHGLYEQGLNPAWEGTPIGPAVSLGVHESQSRLWENLVGRSRAFWTWALPRFVETFPDKKGLTVDALWPALHAVRPSFIRVEADEVTYNLHIAARFGIESALFRGELEVDDLPAAWDDAYEELLGIRPRDMAEGVLQDIHWAMGMFGYFPTYTLGNLINAQLFETARRELGDVEGMVSKGELAPLREWLREKIHRFGSRYPARELVQRATGA